ncbi:DnaB-like helicase N-terminal domain-containing protein [Streptosporangium canum]|uniref:DnaB-like helicase N-terminal domain-containing protein n=1 Tax=Streptosporangium canum TaxID=324952 RepID=UPI00379AF552
MSSLAEEIANRYPATWLEIRAEQALLGALLLQPALITQVRGWLDPEDFFRPLHQDIYSALLAHVDDLSDDPASPSLQQTVMAVWEQVRHTPDLTMLDVHDLITGCPTAAHATTYAVMVVEADIRRTVALHAARLAQALDQRIQGGGTLESLFAAAETAKTIVARLGEKLRIPDLSSVQSPYLDDAVAVPIIPTPEEVDHQDRLLTTLIAYPHQIDDVRPLLDDKDFTAPGRGQLFTVLTTMAGQGSAIDMITVMWQAQRAGLLTPNEEGVQQFQQRFGDPAGESSLWLAQQIQETSALAYATTAAVRLKNAIGVADLHPRELLALASRELNALTSRQPHHIQPTYQPPEADGPIDQAHQQRI